MIGNPGPTDEITTRRLDFRRSIQGSNVSLDSHDISTIPTPPPETTDEQSEQPLAPPGPITASNVKYTLLRMFLVLYIFRVYNGMLVVTWFDPDETWQSLEIAHNVVFGNGILTWEWRLGIRNALHPLMFASVYKIVHLLGLDDTHLLIIAPRILQAFFSALSDCFAFMLSFRLFGIESARWTVSDPN